MRQKKKMVTPANDRSISTAARFIRGPKSYFAAQAEARKHTSASLQ